MSRKISFRLSAAVPLFCVCGIAAFLAGCSENWIAGEPPDTPRNAFRPDPVTAPAPETDSGYGAAAGEAQLASLPPAPVPAAVDEPLPPAPPAVPEPVPAGKPAPKALGPLDEHAGAKTDIKYTVQVNDTLSGIAYIYGIPVEELAAHNGLTVKSTIKPKQVIYIPSEKISDKNARPVQDVKDAEGLAPLDKAAKPKAASGTGKETETAAPAGGIHYTVAEGDTLSGIGARYHVRYPDIAKANGLKADAKLRVGQKLIIPKAKPGAVSGDKNAKQSKPAKQDKAAKQDKPAVKQDKPAAAAADASAASAPAEKSAKTDAAPKTDAESVPSDADIFGDDAEPAAPAEKKAAPAKPASAQPASTAADDPAVVFQFSLPNEMSIRDICRNMGYTEEAVLKLNPGIGADERLSAGRTVTIPMIPDAE